MREHIVILNPGAPEEFARKEAELNRLLRSGYRITEEHSTGGALWVKLVPSESAPERGVVQPGDRLSESLSVRGSGLVRHVLLVAMVLVAAVPLAVATLSPRAADKPPSVADAALSSPVPSRPPLPGLPAMPPQPVAERAFEGFAKTRDELIAMFGAPTREEDHGGLIGREVQYQQAEGEMRSLARFTFQKGSPVVTAAEGTFVSAGERKIAELRQGYEEVFTARMGSPVRSAAGELVWQMPGGAIKVSGLTPQDLTVLVQANFDAIPDARP